MILQANDTRQGRAHRVAARAAAVLAACCVLALPVLPAHAAEQRAHVHGLLKLDIAVDGPSITIAMESPLDSLIGFEHAPRTDDEKKAVEQLVAQLRAADQLFKVDPAGNCKLGPVALQSPALGLDVAPGSVQASAQAAGGHADLDATFSFNCASAPQARFIDVALFTLFKNVRQIDAQIAAPQGQFKRTLKRGGKDARLGWGS
jgi:hypothetical protein